jgi:hypothetical protein
MPTQTAIIALAAAAAAALLWRRRRRVRDGSKNDGYNGPVAVSGQPVDFDIFYRLTQTQPGRVEKTSGCTKFFPRVEADEMQSVVDSYDFDANRFVRDVQLRDCYIPAGTVIQTWRPSSKAGVGPPRDVPHGKSSRMHTDEREKSYTVSAGALLRSAPRPCGVSFSMPVGNDVFIGLGPDRGSYGENARSYQWGFTTYANGSQYRIRECWAAPITSGSGKRFDIVVTAKEQVEYRVDGRLVKVSERAVTWPLRVHVALGQRRFLCGGPPMDWRHGVRRT